jgi:hypothetical protein
MFKHPFGDSAKGKVWPDQKPEWCRQPTWQLESKSS